VNQILKVVLQGCSQLVSLVVLPYLEPGVLVVLVKGLKVPLIKVPVFSATYFA